MVPAAEGVGGARRHHPAGGDDHHRVGQRLGLVHVVGGQHHRPTLGAQPPHHVPGLAPGRGVEPGGGLVQEDQLGIADQGQAEIQPALLATREGLDPCPGLGLQAHQLDDLPHRPGCRIEAGPLGDRLGHGQVRVDGALLEHDAHLGPQAPGAPLGVHTQHRDPPGIPPAVALQDLHRGGLARPVGPEQGQDLTPADLEVDPPDRRRAAVGLGQPLHGDGDVTIGHSPASYRRTGMATAASEIDAYVGGVDPAHGRGHALGDDGLHGVGRLLDGRHQDGPLGGAGTLEHVVGPGLAARRLADAHPHPEVPVGVEVALDGLEAVVAGIAAAGLDLDPARREVELVVDDDEPTGQRLVVGPPGGVAVGLVHPGPAHQGGHGLARLVHVGRGDGQQDPAAADAHLADLGVQSLLGPQAGAAGARPAPPPPRPRRCGGCWRTRCPGCPDPPPAGRPACPVVAPVGALRLWSRA